MKTAAERDILAAVLIAVTALPGVMMHRTNTGAARMESGRMVQFGVPGTPDIVGCVRGRYVGIELKAARGRQSPGQVRFQAACEAAGGQYILARSVDEVMRALGVNT